MCGMADHGERGMDCRVRRGSGDSRDLADLCRDKAGLTDQTDNQDHNHRRDITKHSKIAH